MIHNLNHKTQQQVEEIYTVFQLSYKIEAKLLEVEEFPPLRRTREQFISSTTEFYGYFINHQLAGIVELEIKADYIDINSLVVHSAFFRKGVGGQLVKFVLEMGQDKIITVETALENKPAIRLYEKFGFKETKRWIPAHGIPKVGFEY